MVTLTEYDELLAVVADLHVPGPGRRSGSSSRSRDAEPTTRPTAGCLAGTKVAWRNHARCNGRMHWRSLRLRDCRGRLGRRRVPRVPRAPGRVDERWRVACRDQRLRRAYAHLRPAQRPEPPS